MGNEVLVAASILSADFADMGFGVAAAADWGADVIHCDVMDGVYVPNLTFGMPMVRALRRYSEKPFDVHLMITKPERYIDAFLDAGADFLTFHPDASEDVEGALLAIRRRGKQAGLVLNPDKPLELVSPYLDQIDVLLIMGVYAGFGGQAFLPETLDKLKAARQLIAASGQNIRLEVDGGVHEGNIRSILDAGADMIVAGNAIYRAIDPPETVRRLRGEI